MEQSSQCKICSRIWFHYYRGMGERKKVEISLSPQSSFLAHQPGAFPQFEVAQNILTGMPVYSGVNGYLTIDQLLSHQ